MKSWLLALMLLFSAGAFAQSASPKPPCMGPSPKGCYTKLADHTGKEFRDDDPFLFCTAGMKERPRAWNPVEPITAQWVVTPGYCPFPMTTCPYPFSALKGWSMREIIGLQRYVSVCPAGENRGRWDGKGRPENSPHSH